MYPLFEHAMRTLPDYIRWSSKSGAIRLHIFQNFGVFLFSNADYTDYTLYELLCPLAIPRLATL